jgi:hypothetical protein
VQIFKKKYVYILKYLDLTRTWVIMWRWKKITT